MGILLLHDGRIGTTVNEHGYEVLKCIESGILVFFRSNDLFVTFAHKCHFVGIKKKFRRTDRRMTVLLIYS